MCWLADKKGVPLSIVITSANTHDMKATAETLDDCCIVAKRPFLLQRKRNNNTDNRIVYVLIKDTNNYPEIEYEVVKRGDMYRISVREVKGKNQLRRKEETSSNKKMGCYRKNKFMAQQIQKTTG